MDIEYTTITDPIKLQDLYRKISKHSGTLARLPEECSSIYCETVLEKSIKSGFNIGAYDKEKLVAFIYAYKLDLKIFDHTLANMTIGVDPDYQSQGIGKELMKRFMELVKQNKSIKRVELYTPEPNEKARKLYKQFGFMEEGIARDRFIMNGQLSNDIAMGWLRS